MSHVETIMKVYQSNAQTVSPFLYLSLSVRINDRDRRRLATGYIIIAARKGKERRETERSIEGESESARDKRGRVASPIMGNQIAQFVPSTFVSGSRTRRRSIKPRGILEFTITLSFSHGAVGAVEERIHRRGNARYSASWKSRKRKELTWRMEGS